MTSAAVSRRAIRDDDHDHDHDSDSDSNHVDNRDDAIVSILHDKPAVT